MKTETTTQNAQTTSGKGTKDNKAAAPQQQQPAPQPSAPAPAPAKLTGLAALVAEATEIAPVASAPAPTKETARRVIKDEHVAAVLLLLQRTKEKPAFRVNLTKPVRRVMRRLVKNGIAANGKNADGFAGFWINPSANADAVAEYVRIAKEKKIRPAREVPGAGRSDKDDE